MTTLTVDRLTGTTGAIITDVVLRNADDETIRAIEAALMDRLVLFFPDQSLAPAEQVAFARSLGEVDVAPFGPTHPEVPEMTVLDQQAPQGEGADAWHSDNTFRDRPPAYTMLQSVQLPPLGGDTCWSNMYEAFDALSPAMQEFLDGLTASHDITKMLALAIEKGHSDADLGAMRAAYPVQHHPVVRTHPVTGRKALFVNANFCTRIDQLSVAESRRVLDLLFNHVQSPDFQCRFTWTPGALTLWDNRCLLHYAVPDYQSRRIMHRLIISGDRPV